MRIPSSVKLIFIMKTDPLDRFILKGDGNAAKARYNMQTDPDQESLWVAKWRDDIATFLTKQQWSVPSVALQDIGTHVVRPFYLQPHVKLLDALEADPFQRFVILGFGVDAHVMIRSFRGDEPEIEEFVEHWRLLIASYLLSKSAMLGVAHPLLGLSEIGANVSRPPGTDKSLKCSCLPYLMESVFIALLPTFSFISFCNLFTFIGVPTSVKLIDVMRADPRNRFIIKGDGNALRAKINSGGQAGRISFSSMLTMAQSQKQDEHGDYHGGNCTNDPDGDYVHTYSALNMSKVNAPKVPLSGFTNNSNPVSMLLSDMDINDSFGRLGMQERLPSYANGNSNNNTNNINRQCSTPMMHTSNDFMINNESLPRCHSFITGRGLDAIPDIQQRIRQGHQLSVQQFHQRQGTSKLAPHPPHLSPNVPTFRDDHRHRDNCNTSMKSNPDLMSGRHCFSDSQDWDPIGNSRSPTGWNMAGTMSLDRSPERDGLRIGQLDPSSTSFQQLSRNHLNESLDYDSMSYNSNYSLPMSVYSYDAPNLPLKQDSCLIGGGRGMQMPLGHGPPGLIGGTLLSSHSQSMGEYSGLSPTHFGALGDSDFLMSDNTGLRDCNRSPSTSSLKSQKDRGIVLGARLGVGSQCGYDSCGSEGGLDGEGSIEHSSSIYKFHKQVSRSKTQDESSKNNNSGYFSTSPTFVTMRSTENAMQSDTGSLFSGGYTTSEFDDPMIQDHRPYPRFSRSSIAQPSTLNTTTGDRSFQSELSDPEHQHTEDESASQHSIPLDKWMIKAWLPIVFSGFDYDVIDSFVAQLRDNGGFVTVQDLLDAVARDELTREALADFAGFKVGHCNRLDKALAVYDSKCIPK